jgi:hypothetical protein
VSESPPVWAQATLAFTVTLAVFAGAGLVGGWLWALVTPTPMFEVTRALPDPLPAGAVPSDHFDADAWFLLIGSGAGLVWGFLCAAWFGSRELVTLAAVVVGGGVASFLSWWVGTTIGPAPITEQAATAVVGDTLEIPLGIGATGAYFAWPIAAVAGLLLALSLFPAPRTSPPADPPIG